VNSTFPLASAEARGVGGEVRMATSNRSPTSPLPRERAIILGALIVLAALAWALVLWQSLAMSAPASMNDAMSAPAGLTMGMSAALFLAIWIAMMVAMMFPSAAPMVLMFNAIASGKRQRGQAYAPTWIFVAGYLLIWTLAGVAAYLAALGLDALTARSMFLMENAGRIGGALLIVAGVYQLTPLKNACLTKCRTPTQFIMTSWRDGSGGALRMGIEHGVYCFGCCWLLFAILFPLGMMNIAVLALLTALIFAEKVFPAGYRISAIAGVALIVYGALVIVSPTLLPSAMM
jgi:predicted metal-binding membrane protein